MIGKTILHYKIIEKLGAGGMGVVYKAEDTKLKRDVAIKFLPRQIASNREERKRFEIEAKAAAALNHPNIATIYAIEEVDDEMFIVMEYIEGQELHELVGAGFKPAPTLTLDKIVDYATQIASGLQAAHEKDVTHRDIKSANIMVTGKGQVKIMDFGLAKVRGGVQLTQVGTTLGTAAYMSPEQAQGLETDHRTDIWSFGVVLYEMLTGKMPFPGDYEQAVIYSILNEEPEFSEEIPANLQQLLLKALAKNPQERYQNVGEVLADLESFDTAQTSGVAKPVGANGHSPLPGNHVFLYGGVAFLIILFASFAYFLNRSQPIDSIAVLPFVNSNNDPDIEYLSDGITETLITKLSQLPQLKVMARTGSRFRGKDMTPQQAGEQLNVRAVLTGAIVQRGNALRLNAQWVDVSDGSQFWGKQYNRTMDDIFAVQDAISEQISTSLRLKLSSDDKSRLVKRHTEDTEAYQLYLKGRFYWNQRTGEALRTAVDYFQQAINRDPTYALAYAGIADCYVLLAWYKVLTAIESFPKAKAAALQALQIDDQLAEAHTALAMTYVAFDWDWVSAEERFVRAIELNPNYATAHQWYGAGHLAFLACFDEALTEVKRALALDPLSLIIKSELGTVYRQAGYYDLAIEQLQNTIEMDQNFYIAHYLLGVAYIFKGEISKGMDELRRSHAAG
ncbi:MAG: hypothetical protein E2O76_11610 [Caldithrix sp.]|nr:MAG: hypothetical protein E2O76_11610 [Caldithrix sp.]